MTLPLKAIVTILDKHCQEGISISEKVQKSLITPLPAGLLPTGRQAVPTEGVAGRDYEAITRIINELKNKEKSVESFIGGRLSEKVCLK